MQGIFNLHLSIQLKYINLKNKLEYNVKYKMLFYFNFYWLIYHFILSEL